MTLDLSGPGRTSKRTRGEYDPGGPGWPLSKSLVLAPGLYAASLAYGRNLLNPDHTFDPWRVRNIITWCRPNPPVGALGDKVRPATSYITIACVSGKRYFDLDAVRTEAVSAEHHARYPQTNYTKKYGANDLGSMDGDINSAGAPPLDWWDDALNPDDPTDHMTIVLPTQPYPGAHYATWPAKLAQRLIEMMCPLRVCVTCGTPSERIVGEAEYVNDDGKVVNGARTAQWSVVGQGAKGVYEPGHVRRSAPTLGWSDCGHNTWRPGHTLDPFAGSGTTLAVAQGLGRDATGIELYPANAHLIHERVGMFLEVVA